MRLHLSRDGISRVLTGLLLGLYLYYSFVTLRPFASPDLANRVDGSPIERIYVLGMGAIAILLIALHLRRALMLTRQSGLVWLLTAWCVLSIAWSDYPDLTMRRTILMVLLNLAAFAIALGTTTLWRFHATLMIFLAAVVLVNIASAFLVPSLAWSDLGLRGMYPQKNMAGLVGMISTFVTLTFLLGARRPIVIVLTLGVLLMDVVFLVLTESKTSLALAVIGGLLVPAGTRVLAHDARQRWMAICVTLLVLFALAMLTWYLGGEETLTLLFRDPTFTGRTEIWSFIWSEITRRPWLGYGYGAFWDVGLANDPVLRAPPGGFLAEVEPGVINQAHNGYLEIWVQVGLPALILAVAMVLQSLVLVFRMCIAPKIGRKQWASLCLLLIIVLIYIFSNATEATLFLRGLFPNNLAILVIFLIHRLVLERRIAARLRRWAATAPAPGPRDIGRAGVPAGALMAGPGLRTDDSPLRT